MTTNFAQAGQEFLRSKNSTTLNYYKGLIALRLSHPAFRKSFAIQVKQNLGFLKEPNNIIGYQLNGNTLKDRWSMIVVVHNPNSVSERASLPSKADWKILVQGSSAGTRVLTTLKGARSAMIQAQSTLVLEK
jgi:pullulanase